MNLALSRNVPMTKFLSLLFGAALLMACHALPLTKLTGAELLAMQLGEPVPSIRGPSDITGGSSKLSCQTLVDAEASLPNSGAEMRLLLPVRPDTLPSVPSSPCENLIQRCLRLRTGRPREE